MCVCVCKSNSWHSTCWIVETACLDCVRVCARETERDSFERQRENPSTICSMSRRVSHDSGICMHTRHTGVDGNHQKNAGMYVMYTHVCLRICYVYSYVCVHAFVMCLQVYVVYVREKSLSNYGGDLLGCVFLEMLENRTLGSWHGASRHGSTSLQHNETHCNTLQIGAINSAPAA